MPATIRDWLSHRAATTPARIALEADGRAWRFSELDSDASRTARRLASLGIGPGDRVATLLRNGAAPVILAHAVLRLGAVLVPLNTRLTEPELAWQLGDATPRLLVIDDDAADLAHGLRRQHPGLRVTPCAEIESQSPADVPCRLEHPTDDVLAIIYTSGTTGRPKGAMLTVANFWWSALGSAMNIGLHTDDRWLACLPLFHVGGLSIVLRSAIYGTAAIVHGGFDEHAVNRAIDEDRVTIVSVVAVMLQRMLEARNGRPYPSTLRCVLLGGGPALQPLLERCAELGVPLAQTYGLTETTSQLSTLPPEEALRKLGSAGRPLYPNDIRIAQRAGANGADDAGEILVRGPVVMAGYLNRQAETDAALRDGWLHTGDIGRVDAEGFLYVLDRRDDLVITGGENVYPAEVEAVLLAHPLVAEACVVGIPDDRWGQRVIAVVRLTESASTTDQQSIDETLRAYCRGRLAAYKAPTRVSVMAGPLPRTASGKLRRTAVREMLTAPSVIPHAP